MSIHPLAVIDPRAEIDSTVEISPFVVIEGAEQIGADTIVGFHAYIRALNKVFRAIFKTEGVLLKDALAQVTKDYGDSAPVARLVNFFKVPSRNVARVSSDE